MLIFDLILLFKFRITKLDNDPKKDVCYQGIILILLLIIIDLGIKIICLIFSIKLSSVVIIVFNVK